MLLPDKWQCLWQDDSWVSCTLMRAITDILPKFEMSGAAGRNKHSPKSACMRNVRDELRECLLSWQMMTFSRLAAGFGFFDFLLVAKVANKAKLLGIASIRIYPDGAKFYTRLTSKAATQINIALNTMPKTAPQHAVQTNNGSDKATAPEKIPPSLFTKSHSSGGSSFDIFPLNATHAASVKSYNLSPEKVLA